MNWKHLIFSIIMVIIWIIIFLWMIFKFADNNKKKRYQFLRESFSPMSNNIEIQKAYDIIRNKQYYERNNGRNQK